MATKRPRYMISVDDEMFNAIEDFRFENRFQTRSEATAELIRLGLESLNKDLKKEVVNPISTIQKNLEEMSLEELDIEKQKAEAAYIKNNSNFATKEMLNVSNSTVDIKNLKNENTNGRASNQ